MRLRWAVAVSLAVLAVAGCGTSSHVVVGGAPTRSTTRETGVITTGAGTSTTLLRSSSSAARPTSTDASGRTTVEDVPLKTLAASGRGAGYSIEVPESWTTIDPASGTPEDVAAKIAELFPDGPDPDALASAIRQGLVLFAIDPVSGANVNVLVQNETVSLDLLAGQIDKQLASIGAAPPTLSRPTIAGRDALRADTSISSPNARLTQLYVATDTQTYITTITSPSNNHSVPVEAMAASIAIA